MKRFYLRTVREHRRLTQEQLEGLSGIAQNTICRLERDAKARPLYTTVEALADALHVNSKQLCFGPDPQARPKSRVA
jgi:transcriptional regulator with XRE-family HTH domain